jgi:GR25 family glycosyltransferase involved in LPS biosynthesis
MFLYMEILQKPCYLINLDRCQDRLDRSLKNIREAGFTDIRRIQGVDGLDKTALEEEWKTHGEPSFNTMYAKNNNEGKKFANTHHGKQGCMLSHLKVWKTIIDSGSDCDMFTVFEDDVLFHSDWANISNLYMSHTPKDFDILFIGNQINAYTSDYVLQVPTYCTHAYVITRSGAKKLYDAVLTIPGGVYTIDMLLVDLMEMPKPSFVWYCWNVTRNFPCQYLQQNRNSIGHAFMIRNTGAVFQDHTVVSLIGGND